MLGLEIVNINVATKIDAQGPVFQFLSLVVYRAGATSQTLDLVVDSSGRKLKPRAKADGGCAHGVVNSET